MSIGHEEKISSAKLTSVQYAILGIFLLLVFGLWRLQVSGNDRYESLAELNRVRTVPILAPRGKILDREGRIIVDNYPSFSALLVRDQARDFGPDLPQISQGLHISVQEIRDRLRRFASEPKFNPMTLKDDLTPDELAFL